MWYVLVRYRPDRAPGILNALGSPTVYAAQHRRDDRLVTFPRRCLMGERRYEANFAKASLKVPEARIVAGLLLSGVGVEGFREAIIDRNVLQKRSALTARDFGYLAKARLSTLGEEVWRVVRDGSLEAASQAVFAASAKFSPLFGDFVDIAVRDRYRMRAERLEVSMWSEFLDGCSARDPGMPRWSDATRAKLGQNAFRMLAEAGYIGDSKRMEIQRVPLDPSLVTVLRDSGEDYALRCLQPWD